MRLLEANTNSEGLLKPGGFNSAHGELLSIAGSCNPVQLPKETAVLGCE
jgi:hypothetical protein